MHIQERGTQLLTQVGIHLWTNNYFTRQETRRGVTILGQRIKLTGRQFCKRTFTEPGDINFARMDQPFVKLVFGSETAHLDWY